MKKWLVTFLIMFMFFTCINIPVYAKQETDTAGSSLDKTDVDTYKVGRSTYSEGWKKDSTGWWYQYGDGSYPAAAWRKIDGKWYYFNNDGYWVDNNTYEENTIKGIDVSHWQGTIDWQQVKRDGIEFAFIRIGRGGRVLDENYVRNIRNANAAGIHVGVYYYSKARTINEAILDAQFVIKNVTGYKISYPVVIDIEDASQASLSKVQLGAIAKAFCDEIRSAGYTPMLYTNENWYRTHIDISQLKNVDKWIARYNYFYSNDIQRNIWQCTSKGKVEGISGNVDINFGYTDYSRTITPRTAPLSSYVPKIGEWKSNNTGWWYSYYEGGYPVNSWKMINGKWYWFNAQGYMQTGWVMVGGKWYYLNASGEMQTGWIMVGGKWYYLNASGEMQTGWIMVGGKWYYLNVSGEMQIGWLKLGNTWYYLKSNGEMVNKDTIIDGKVNRFNSSGVWLGTR